MKVLDDRLKKKMYLMRAPFFYEQNTTYHQTNHIATMETSSAVVSNHHDSGREANPTEAVCIGSRKIER